MEELVPAAGNELFRTYLSDMVSMTLELDTSKTYKIAKVAREHDFEWFYEGSGMLIAPELDQIVSNDSPPPVEIFDVLPNALKIPSKVLRKYQIVYLLLLVKPDEEPRMQIGSAASQSAGASPRIGHYKDDIVWMFSKYTKKSLEQGYKIRRVGMLLAIPLPKNPVDRPVMRAWVLILEGTFTYTIWTVWQEDGESLDDHPMGQVCAWETRWYTGLATHSPLREGVAGIELTREELIEKEAQRKERQRKYGRIYDKKKRELKYPGYMRVLEMRKEARAELAAVRNGKLEMDQADQKAIGRALAMNEQSKRSKDKFKQRDKDDRQASLEVLRQVKKGQADITKPEVAAGAKKALNREITVKKYLDSHKEQTSATRKANYDSKKEDLAIARKAKHKDSVEAIEAVERGELDGNDPKVKERCSYALRIRENNRRAYENKKAKDAAKEEEKKKTNKAALLNGFSKMGPAKTA